MDIPVLLESDSVLHQMPLSELFADENVSNFSENTIPSNDSWQIASSRRSARNARQLSRMSPLQCPNGSDTEEETKA